MDDGAEQCPDCRTVEDVVEEWVEKWHTKCHDCAYHGRHGYSRTYAARAIERHNAIGHRTYVVWYAEDVPLQATVQLAVRAEKLKEKLDGMDQTPPF